MAEIHARSWEAAYNSFIPPEYIKAKNAGRQALYSRILTVENDCQYVIQADGNTVGILCVAPPQAEAVPILHDTGVDESVYEVHGIYLHPDFYHKGIGTQAMEFALGKARDVGKSTVILWVFAENKSAIRFYETCGFAFDGAEKTYSCGKELRCLRMRRTIKKDPLRSEAIFNP